MAVLKLHLDEFDEVDYDLIAIHSSLEDFRLAYFINQQLPITLSRSKEEVGVVVKEGEAFFSKFQYDDIKNGVLWTLIQNQNDILIRQKNADNNLFIETGLEVLRKVHLISELKKVDYFLKIENNAQTFTLSKIISQLNKIERVTAAYIVIPENIKSKNNLIF
ncbi:IPExxxVDY family protein [Flavobacterium sp. CYK-4]|uniref:IPExxxVDY family protein n=1 Tax=Flavobacterium lotistagni TaxID=2709660 RepID=UPI00140C1A35|nr:IPExxxVDY family protein [Flavobacterium lotistagni]NHM06024.1 IPExxxVDY family protein [Flavobacterium lotistagni]